MRCLPLILFLLLPCSVLADPALVDAALPPRYDDVLGSASTVETFRMTGAEPFDPERRWPEPADRVALSGALGDERFFLGLHDDTDLLAIAARVFPHDPRLIEYRRKELLHAVHASRVEEIDAFAVFDAPDDAVSLEGFPGRGAGPHVRLSPEQHDRLMALLTRTSSFALEPKLCEFEPTVEYRVPGTGEGARPRRAGASRTTVRG